MAVGSTMWLAFYLHSTVEYNVCLSVLSVCTYTGTNDKAGAASFLQRWVSPISIKETTVPYTEWSYPSVDKS